METDTRKINEELLAFLDASPNAFFAVDNMKRMLVQAGFTELKEHELWGDPAGRFMLCHTQQFRADRVQDAGDGGL